MRLIAIALLITVAATALPAFAAIDLNEHLTLLGSNAGFNEQNDLATTIGLIINGLLSILGVIFMVYIVYGGYLWMIARGDEEKVTRAKAIIRGSIIGVIIVLAAYAITAFILFRVGTATGRIIE